MGMNRQKRCAFLIFPAPAVLSWGLAMREGRDAPPTLKSRNFAKGTSNVNALRGATGAQPLK